MLSLAFSFLAVLVAMKYLRRCIEKNITTLTALTHAGKRGKGLIRTQVMTWKTRLTK